MIPAGHAPAGHTPGPWEVGSAAEGSSLHMDRMVYCDDALGSRVADCSKSGHGISVAQERANARLIAAAPDLLAVARRAEAVLTIVAPRIHTAEYLETLAELRAALSRATGSQP